MGFFLVLKAEVVRSFIIMRRYWFASLTGLVISYSFMIGFFFLFISNPDALTEAIQNWMAGFVGFFLGVLCMGIIGMFTQGLQGMARTGELEQVCMSPHGLVTNFLARSLVSSVLSVIMYTILLSLIAVTLKGQISFAPLPSAVIMALAYLNIVGFGFMMGGLVLVFKRTGKVAMIIRLAIVFVAIQVESLTDYPPIARGLAHIFPSIDAAICLKYVLIRGQMVDGVYESVFLHPSFFFLVINSIAWTFIGISCFKYFENWSRDKGTLGTY